MGREQEAYDNFKGYASTAGDITQVSGYSEWASANPDLVTYAQQGFDSGRQSVSNTAAITTLMDQFNQTQEPGAFDPGGKFDPQGTFTALSNTALGFTDIENLWRQEASQWTTEDTFESVYGATAEDRTYGYQFNATTGKGRWMPISREEVEAGYDDPGFRSEYSQIVGKEGDVFASIEGARAEQTAGTSAVNEAYGTYQGAGRRATSEVDQAISREQSNAALIGVEYSTSDEIRQGRISDQFAQYWNPEDQSRLDTLVGKFGYGDIDPSENPQYTIGDAGQATPTDPSGTTLTTSVGGGVTPTPSGRVTSLLDEEDTQTLGA